jgi:PAS domain S-box-containing protein
MPNIENYWIKIYGQVATSGKALRFENYSAELDKFFDVWAFSPNKGQFAVVFSDITENRKAEEEIKKKNEFIQTILDNLPIGIALNDINAGNATYMNKKFEEIYGWSQDELKNISNFFENVYPDKEYRDKLFNRVSADINSGNPERMKWNNIVVTHKDGTQSMVNAVNIPLFAQNTMISTVMDISEIKKAEEAIQESEELFRCMFYESFAVMLIIDPITRVIVDANQSAERFYGWKKDELQNLRIDDINTLSTYKLEREIKNVLTQKRVLFNFQHRIKGGEVKDVEVLCSRITIKGKNYLHSIVNDVTEKRKTEEQIVKLTKGIEQSPAIVLITDIKGNIEYVNPKFIEVTGYSYEEVIGQNPKILKSGYQSDDFYSSMWQTILDGNDWKGEFLNKKKNGDLYWESTSISPIRNENGKIKYFIAVKQDITDRKQTELELYERDLRLKEQNEEYVAINEELTESNERIRAINKELVISRERAEENDRLKSAFLANMSHELRTPMNGIIGFAELLKRPQMSDEDRINYTKIIEQSGQRLLELINNLIDISKIEAGQVKAIVNTVDITTELNHIYNFFKLEAESKGICLLLQGGKELPELSIETDKQKFISIITNLIKNAIKFTTKGTIGFGFDVGQTQVEFWVSDTGMGIPKKIQTRIFERFVQGDTSLSRPYEGAGLGLAISKSYVELLGGKISFESEEGVGTTFYFYLPLSKPEGTSDLVNNQLFQELEMVNRNLTVLIAEDDKNSMFYLQNLLEPYVRKIYYAETGQKAIQIVRSKHNIDVVLMDIRLPDINGLEVTRRIREFDPEIKIIAQTAFALAEDKLAAKKVGCNDYIVKPILPNNLYQSIIGCFNGNSKNNLIKINN